VQYRVRFPTQDGAQASGEMVVPEGEPLPSVGCAVSVLYDARNDKYYVDGEVLDEFLLNDRLGQVISGSVLLFCTVCWMLYYHIRKHSRASKPTK
jgi:hypothetical protein